MIGESIEKYKILEEIGQGGMATVYRAFDKTLKRDVAIKILHPHLASQKEAIERFQREAFTVAKLQHPNIIDIYDYSGDASAHRFIVTELIDGMTLGEFCEIHGAIPCELVACIGREICLALHEAHEQGIIHRDLKPDNIMIRVDGKIKLMDFGIARVLEGTNLTVTGSILGSPAFMSPEQITGKDIDFSSDLFSLGSILYQLVTGEMPFTGQNPHEILKKVVDGDCLPIQELQPSISNEFTRVIESVLKTDPDNRIQSAGELLGLLDNIIDKAEINTPAIEVNKLFADPPKYIEIFNQHLVESLLKQAAAKGKNSPVIAMQLYSRIAAIDPNNEEANLKIDQLISKADLKYRIKIMLSIFAVLFLCVTVFSLFVKFYQPLPVVNQSDEVMASFPIGGDVDFHDSEKAKTKNKATKKSKPNKTNTKTYAKIIPVKLPDKITKIAPIKKKEELKSKKKQYFASVHVKSKPWAYIFINGVKVGNSMFDSAKKYPLIEGKNIVKLVNPKCQTYTKTINVSKKGQSELIVRSLKMRAFLKIDNSQSAMVFVDGSFKGRTPIKLPLEITWKKLTSSHKVLLSMTLDGHKPQNRHIKLVAGETSQVSFELAKKN